MNKKKWLNIGIILSIIGMALAWVVAGYYIAVKYYLMVIFWVTLSIVAAFFHDILYSMYIEEEKRIAILKGRQLEKDDM